MRELLMRKTDPVEESDDQRVAAVWKARDSRGFSLHYVCR